MPEREKARDHCVVFFWLLGERWKRLHLLMGNSELLRGTGVLASVLGITIEIVGLALLDDSDNQREK